MILTLVKTNTVRCEVFKTKELRLFLESVVGYERYVTTSGDEELWIYRSYKQPDAFSSTDWDKDSWDNLISTLEKHFTEPETRNPTPPSGTKPDLNYYY